MDVKRSYVEFLDGHKEDIFYYKDLPNDCVLFSTKSDIYFYKPAPNTPGVAGLRAHRFYTISMTFENTLTLPNLKLVEDSHISHIMIDRRIEMRFTVPDHGSGTILIHPNASKESIALAIMSELGVEIEDI